MITSLSSIDNFTIALSWMTYSLFDLLEIELLSPLRG